MIHTKTYDLLIRLQRFPVTSEQKEHRPTAAMSIMEGMIGRILGGDEEEN